MYLQISGLQFHFLIFSGIGIEETNSNGWEYEEIVMQVVSLIDVQLSVEFPQVALWLVEEVVLLCEVPDILVEVVVVVLDCGEA